MNYTVTSVVGSHVGAVRYNHEDNYLLNGEHFLNQQQMRLLNDSNRTIAMKENHCEHVHRIICSVADGMGGYQAGDVASLVTVQLLKQSQRTIIESNNFQKTIQHYQDFLNLLNNHVLKLSNANSLYEEMGSTLTTLLLHEGQVAIISLGDSSGYVFSPLTGLTKLTVEQNYGQILLNRHAIVPSQLDEIPDYKHLTKYIGMEHFEQYIEGHVSSIIEIEKEKLFLLCSDGITDHLIKEEIEEVLTQHYESKNWQAAIEALVTLAVQKGGLDNITAMLISIVQSDDEN